MIDERTKQDVRQKTLEMFEKAHIVLTDKEKENIEYVDLGMNDIYDLGLQIVVYVNTQRVCAKEICLLPFQTCPEHMHPPVDGKEGKEEQEHHDVHYCILSLREVEEAHSRNAEVCRILVRPEVVLVSVFSICSGNLIFSALLVLELK